MNGIHAKFEGGVIGKDAEILSTQVILPPGGIPMNKAAAAAWEGEA